MAATISQLTPQRLDVPSCTGKRTRSNSTSSSASSVTSSAGASSIFSNTHSGSFADNLSSYSSPSSEHTSPSSLGSISDDERPCKSLRTNSSSVGPISSRSAEEDVVATLTNLEQKCTLSASSSVEQSDSKDVSPSPPVSGANSGKSFFVDCLVDATVHVLTMIWNAPVHKSIAFLENVNSVSPFKQDYESSSDCTCPVGSPVTGGIPLDLFIRETLRRSRTSCSTLQAALLYCKRVGFEVVRKRAETEGVSLSVEQQQFLKGNERDYASLSKSMDAATEASLPVGVSADPILCSRRTFLASIMISSKFLQDRTFSNRAWSKISGLNVKELGIVERRMLSAIEFDLSVSESDWQVWTQYLKGEWRKVSVPLCACKSNSASMDLVKSVVNVLATMKGNSVMASANLPKAQLPIRKSLERTSSIHVERANDLEVQATSCASSGSSTPVQDNRMSMSSTPTRLSMLSGVHKREHSMLATAVTNNMIGSVLRTESPSVQSLNATPTQSSVHEHDAHSNMEMPLPFPFRKGLAVRSISALS